MRAAGCYAVLLLHLLHLLHLHCWEETLTSLTNPCQSLSLLVDELIVAVFTVRWLTHLSFDLLASIMQHWKRTLCCLFFLLGSSAFSTLFTDSKGEQPIGLLGFVTWQDSPPAWARMGDTTLQTQRANVWFLTYVSCLVYIQMTDIV